MKKLVYLFLLLGLSVQAQEKIKVVCSVSMISDMAKNIVGESATIQTIVPIGGDPHTYEATPRDAKLVGDADIIFINGLNFEGWIEELISNSGTKGPTIVVTDGVKPIASEVYKDSFDPHAWMNAGNGLQYSQNIFEAMSLNFPNHTEEYRKNFGEYKSALIALDKYIQESIHSIPEKQRVLITSHDAFNYYGQKYGIEVEAILGISTEAEARSSDIVRVAKKIKDSKVAAIFIESTINPKLIKRLADDNGVPIGGELFADSLGKEGSEGDTYIGMLKHNTDVITQALSSGILSETKLDSNTGSSTKSFIIIGIVLALFLIFAVLKLNK